MDTQGIPRSSVATQVEDRTYKNGNTSFPHHMLESVFLKVKPYDSIPPLCLAATSPVGVGGGEGVGKGRTVLSSVS